MIDPSDSAKKLYGNARQGSADVTHRLSANTSQGTLDFARELADRLDLKDGLSVLDVGCGPAHHLSRFLVDHSVEAHGIDRYLEALEDDRIVFRRASADSLPYDAGRFDRVMCNYALYYVPQWKTALEEMSRVTRPGSRILLSGPALGNNEQFYGLHRHLFGGISDIDLLALGFMETLVEPYLQGKGSSFIAETLENHIGFPTIDTFLAYYSSTSLFRMTVQDGEAATMLATIRDAVTPLYSRSDRFVITKKIRLVTIEVE